MTTSHDHHGTRAARRGRYLVLSVECGAGINGEREPHAFSMGKRRVIVDEIIDRWLATDHQYFKVRADDSGTYILRYDANRAIWEMTLFDSGRTPKSL
ncbi:MAG TPA: hypothetical protein VFL97_03015 [Nitrococcus sp.]|nr:hypothetical protein [Nitrococcus sp.]